MGIFQKSVIQKYLNNLDKELVEKAFQQFRESYSPAKIEKIKLLKEEEYQDGFLRDLFVNALGYTLKPDENYNLAREFKNQVDAKKADGAILKNEKAIAVIELKSTKTKDLKSITEQAFNYKNNQPDCKYVITSNFQKLRFYIDYANEFEEFDLFHLQKPDFELLYLILNKNSIFSDLPLKLKEETKFHEQNISNKLYNDYSLFKNRLFENLVKNNPENDKLTLFKKSQKLLDRFLFILFAEDSGLLPPNSISRIVKRFEVLKEEDAYKPIYDIYKQYFGYMNIGRKGKTTADDIPAYNGGLFYADELLDNLKIDDEILIDDLLKLSEYDFSTEVDVNILGHIFEHSLSEIEEITAEIEGTTTDKTKNKRKKDGVFYTPKYITQYIVENTIGTLCNEKRTELGIEEIEFDGTYRTKDGNLSVKGKKLFQKLNDYKEWLLSLKIVDPACGSGAFLNQALNFLIQEHKNIDDIIAELTNTALRLFDTEKSILENNLFGVDINEESVEIAKLSLWLRTAHKNRKLSNLNNNIKCGNSLIDDPEVAGNKAFNWQKEFPQVFKNGGFDVVIGNPPYVMSGISNHEKIFYKSHYILNEGKPDLYRLFIEKAFKILKDLGQFAFIIPNSLLTIPSSKKIRKYLLEKGGLETICNFWGDVFKNVGINSIIIIARKNYKNSQINIINDKSFYPTQESLNLAIRNNEKFDKIFFINERENAFNINQSKEILLLLKKIQANSVNLSNIADYTLGMQVYHNTMHSKETIKNREYHSTYKKDKTYFPESGGQNIKRYVLKEDFKEYVSYGEWCYNRPNWEFCSGERLLVREIPHNGRLVCSYTDSSHISNKAVIIIKSNKINNKYILTLINSTLLGFYTFVSTEKGNQRLFPRVSLTTIKNLPLKSISKEAQQPFIEKANKMLLLNKQLQEKKNKFLNRIKDNLGIEKFSKKLDVFYDNDFKAFTDELKKQKIKLSLVQQDEWEVYFNSYKREINQLQDEINTTDEEIDQMVYKLYELTEEEIKIIETAV